MRAWGLFIVLISVVVLGGTFLATMTGLLSGRTLTAIYISFAALLAIGVVLFAVFDPRATLTPEQAARVNATRQAANTLAAHRSGTRSGVAFRAERQRVCRRDALNVEQLEQLLVDPDNRTRTLATALLVAGGPELAVWAEDRYEELADLPSTQALRDALERVARLARVESEPDELNEVFR